MTTLKNILVPVDFSDCSKNALNYAIRLAMSAKAHLTLLNCYTVHVNAAEVTVDLHPQLSYELEKNAKDSFEKLEEEIPQLKEVPHTGLTRMSFIVKGIEDVVSEEKIDLVVMGTKGASNRVNELFGSNTYHMIKKSRVPVLVVPDEARFDIMKNLLFAADFKHIKNMHSLDMIKVFLSFFNAKVEVLHLGESWSDLSTQKVKEAAAIIDYFSHTEHSYHFVAEETDIEDGINEHLAKSHNDLLILIARKHYFPGKIFKRKMTRRAVLRSKIPLLTIPDTK